MINQDDILTLRISEIVYRGNGLSKTDGMVVFVPGTAPGDLVKARVTSVKKRFCEAVVVEIIEPSPVRVEPCARLAGGVRIPVCVYDHIAYNSEVNIKNQQLKNFLRNVADDGTEFLEPFASPAELHYRNKVVFHVQRDANGIASIGYFGDDNRTVVDVDVCPLALDAINFAWRNMRDNAKRRLPDGASVTLRHTDADGVVSWVDSAPADAPWLTEQTLGRNMTVPPDGFFQVNPFVAPELVRQVCTWAEDVLVTRRDISAVLDLYCGVGVFAVSLASELNKARECGKSISEVEFRGIESGRNAIAAAKRNAKMLGIGTARFQCATVASAAKTKFAGLNLGRTLVIADPPRQGMEPDTVKTLAASSLSDMIYVSCDPATLSRDLTELKKTGFRIKAVRMFDMFPRTMHFETVVLMSRVIAE